MISIGEMDKLDVVGVMPRGPSACVARCSMFVLSRHSQRPRLLTHIQYSTTFNPDLVSVSRT